ncbi:TBC1 domain family member 10A isoform X2 [Rhinichthys klamathensis goyatoka]|uniref:TBC1 domain family member 10A isoform X2 n=1 Tax=Rhinichthys klamathensis goyatoka TaxID=3034132 RepID=UPI0024B609D9|nr:TBC1 domain family member 10A isoform X2 [Rhinichthys klamathensis goyatoka]
MMAQLENGRVSSDDTMSVMTLGSQFDEESSFGSDSEINGFTSSRQTDKYGFIGGAQKYSTESAQEVPLEVLRHREVKWLDMLNHWDRWISKRFKKVRLRCQKGIPPSLRGRAWLYLSGGKVKREQNVGKFNELDSMDGDPKWIDVIERDLHRQFPFHEMFVSRGGHGQQDLFRVLKAYTLYRPDEGYCQAQAPIAAVLLMHMPAEDAFWGLVQICEKYLPGYYSAGLEAIQLDGLILNALLKRVSPPAYRHLEKHKIEPILYMTEWYMCAFSRTLPWSSVLRVWDMFLCDGVKIMFRVGLVLLKCMLGSREKLKACPGQYETMELLRALEPQYMQEGFLVHQVLELPISARDVEREHRMQLKRWRKTHGELSYKSPPRMHGAQAIMSAEPHSRQDLRQNPTIVVQYPLQSDTKSDFARIRKRSTIRKALIPLDVPNPYALPTDPRSNPLKDKAQDKPSNRPPPSLQQSLLTTPEKTVPCSDPPASVPNPSLSVIPTPNPSLSVIPTIPTPNPSLSVIPTPNSSLSVIPTIPTPNPSLAVIPTIPTPNPSLSVIPTPNSSLSVIPTIPTPNPSLAVIPTMPTPNSSLSVIPTIPTPNPSLAVIPTIPTPNPSLAVIPTIPTPNPSLSVIPTIPTPNPSLSVIPTIPTPNPSLSVIPTIPTPNPSLSVIPTIPTPNPSLSVIPNPSLSVIPTIPTPNPSPSLSRTPPSPQTSPDPNPTHPTELPHSSNPEITAEPLPIPKNSSNTNNSAHLKDPPPTTDSTPLLPDDAPVNGDSVAAPTVPGLRHSFESVGSEDTYL